MNLGATQESTAHEAGAKSTQIRPAPPRPGDDMPGREPPSRPARRIWLRTMGVGRAIPLLGLAAAVLAALVQSRTTAKDDASAERTRIIDGAAGLLVNPAPMQSSLDLATRGSAATGDARPPWTAAAPMGDKAKSQPEAGVEVQAAAGAKSDAPAPNPGDPAASLAPLRDLLPPRATPDLRSLTQLTAAESEALASTHAVRQPLPGTARTLGRSQPTTPIPDTIEGVMAAPRSADALAPYTITAALRMLAAEAPFVLLEIRLAPGPARARFAPRAREGSAPPSVGWLELGDSPLPGWRIIRIEAQSVTFMTPHGNPARMALAAAAAAAPTRNPAARDGASSRED
jgi:hypothetical protein